MAQNSHATFHAHPLVYEWKGNSWGESRQKAIHREKLGNQNGTLESSYFVLWHVINSIIGKGEINGATFTCNISHRRRRGHFDVTADGRHLQRHRDDALRIASTRFVRSTGSRSRDARSFAASISITENNTSKETP